MEASDIAAGNAAAQAAAVLDAHRIQITAPSTGEDADLPPVKFDRLSVERRVLGHVTDEVNITALGPRNTLAAITYDLMTDRNTTHPPSTHPRLEVDGVSTEEIAAAVLAHLTALQDAGLLEARADGTYAVTEAGHLELAS